MFDTIKNVIGTVAPVLATALGGPFAGAAVSAIGKAIGLGESATAQQVIDKIQNQPLTSDQLLALKQEDNNFKLEMARIDSQNMQTQANVVKDTFDDVANARAMASEAANKVRLELVRWLGVITAILMVGEMFLFFSQSVQSDESYAIGYLNAGIIGMWMLVLGFYFGTGVDKVMQYFKRDNSK